MSSLPATEIYQKILELRTQDEATRVSAIKFIPIMAEALGSSRTSEELIPYIVDSAIFTEDQWIEVLNEFGKINYSRFSNKEMNNVLFSICTICEMESRAIREAFINCFASIVENLQEKIINDILKQIIFTLVKHDSSPSMRAAGILIYAKSISKFSPSVKSSMFMTIEPLKEDPAVNVRQSYAASAALIIPYVKGALISNLLTSITILASDESYSVCCEIPSFLSAYMKTKGNPETALEIGAKLLSSNNWRVRCMYIASLHDIFKDQDLSFDSIFDILSQASNDSDDEVKTAAAEELIFLSTFNNIDPQKVQTLISELLKSSCPHVKTSTAKAIPEFAGILDPDFVWTSLINLTKDQSQEVKITAIESLKSPKVPAEIKLQGLNEAAQTNEWREKESIVKLLPDISYGANNDFEEIVVKMLKDDASKVRRTMIDKLPLLVGREGSDLKEKLIPHLKEMINSDDYQLRQTAVSATLKIQLFDDVGMGILKTASDDLVANVRLVLAEQIPKTPQFQSIIDKLKSDSDVDIQEAIN